MSISIVVGIQFMLSMKAASAATVTAAQINAQIAQLVGDIKGAQHSNGAWEYSGNRLGFTALNVLALATAGVPESDPVMQRAIRYLQEHFPSRSAYAVGLYAAAFQAIDTVAYRDEIKRAADWLIAHQRDGTWNYRGTGPGDNSVTQFAMLGIKAAVDAGIAIPPATLKATATHFRTTQNGDGGWGYRSGAETRASMIPAGLSSLAIAGVPIEQSLELAKGPSFLGQYTPDPVIARGLLRLGQQLNFKRAYMTYGIERVGIFYDQQRIGNIDWYQRGCEKILGSGGWDISQETWSGCPTQFHLLFLAKGNRPPVITKIRWGEEHTDWNNRHYDVPNMVRFLSTQFQHSLDWQTHRLDTDQSNLTRTPILYISGHQRLLLSANELRGLRAFIDNGGTVLFAPNLRSRDFVKSTTQTLRRLYPGCRFEPLPDFHPMRGMYFDLFEQALPVRVWRSGCVSRRIFIFEEDLSLESESGLKSDMARKLVANFARFALKEQPLISRFETRKKRRTDHTDHDDYTRTPGTQDGALSIAQIRYPGDDDPDVTAIDNFLGFLRQGLAMPTARSRQRVTLSEPLHHHPLLYLTGHDRLPFSAKEKASLRDYLTRGGFLVADACCSRIEFDQSFRFLLKVLFPNNSMHAITDDSPIYHEPFELAPALNPALARQTGSSTLTNYLWGLRLNDRYVVVYSPWDFGCSMDNHLEDDIAGFKAPFSYQLLSNIVSYALTY